MLEPVEDRNVDEAVAILSRGFPSRSTEFWHSGLMRLSKYHNTISAAPLGYVMKVKGAPAGVILTMRSERADPSGQPRSVLNLSSWYVDEAHRWLAPRMLQKVLSEQADLFTDLTPSEPVREMIGRLGFVRRHEGVLMAALALSAMRFGTSARVSGADEAGMREIGAGAARLLADHAALGCIVALLRTSDRVHPLVFLPTRRKGLPSARLVYAPNLTAVRDHIGAVARYLLAQGVLFVEIPANPGDSAFGAWFTRRPPPTFMRGEVAEDMVDHAYSEFVFLQI
jgi:hypothetical protein